MDKMKWFGVSLVLIFGIGLAYFAIGHNPSAGGVYWENMSALDRTIGVSMLFSVFFLWGWMLVDFFKRRPKRYAVLWGFSLIFFSYPAAIVYFFVEYLRRSMKWPHSFEQGKAS